MKKPACFYTLGPWFALVCLLLWTRAGAQIPDNIDVTQPDEKVNYWNSPLFIAIFVGIIAFMILFFWWSSRVRKNKSEE